MDAPAAAPWSHWRTALDGVRAGGSKSRPLAQAIAQDIEAGVLERGWRLPPQRQLGEALGLSLQTVTNAYRELERHGLIRCEVGRGSFVCGRAGEQVASRILDHAEHRLVDFSIARIVHTSAHDRAWQRACADLAKQPHQPWMRECRPIAGLPAHRHAGVQWLRGLGLQTDAERLLVTNGASHAIFIALAALLKPGDVVVGDSLLDHGFIGAAQVLGFTLKGLDVDEHGIRPEHFEDLCASERISALVCTPNLNNPTCTLMPEARRQAIARIAERYGVHVVEDDVYGPLLAQRPPPISSLLPDLGLYCTSFTKSVMCGLRTGYLSVPRRLALRANSVLRVNSWMGAPLLAEVAARWVADGTAQALVRQQRQVLAPRQALVTALLEPLVRGQHAHGLSAWIEAPDPWRPDALAQALRARGVAVSQPEPFMLPGGARPQAFRICVGADAPLAQVRTALATVAEVCAQANPSMTSEPRLP